MWGGSGLLNINFVDFSVKKVLFNLFNFIRKRVKFLFFNISLKNAPLFTKSPFLAMDLAQTEIRSGNVQLDKMYSLYLI